MAFCTVKSLTYLDGPGYDVVRLPRKGSDPGKDSVTFGFKAFAIAFDGKWCVTGAAPGAAVAFEAGSDPVILGRATLQLR